MRFHTTFAALMPTLLLTAKAASVLNTGISPRQTYDNIYNEENDKQQTDEDIKTLCIDKGGAALWRPKRGESGKANLDSQGEIQDFDVGMTEGATYNWLYGARLAAMRSLAHRGVDPRLMFQIDGKSTKENGWCLTPDNQKLTITFGHFFASYEGKAYKDLLAQLATIRVVHDRSTHWVYLLGKALKNAIPAEKPEEDYEISEIAPFLVKYCSALQGRECVAVEGKSASADPSAEIIEGVKHDAEAVASGDAQPVLVILTDGDHGADFSQGVFSVEFPSCHNVGDSQVTYMDSWSVWNSRLGQRDRFHWPLVKDADVPLTLVHIRQ